jgi:hypothetical protein
MKLNPDDRSHFPIMYAAAAATSSSSAVPPLSGASSEVENRVPPIKRERLEHVKTKTAKKTAAAASVAQRKKDREESLKKLASTCAQIFPGVACADPAALRFLPSPKLTSIEAQRWFLFCKAAPTRYEVLSCLTLFAACHQSQTSYITRTLAPRLNLWADCYKAWVFTLGLQYSSVAEHWFRSIMHVHGKELVPLTGVIGAIKNVAKRREVVTYQANEKHLVKITYNELLGDLRAQGLANVISPLIRYALPEGAIQSRKPGPGLVTLHLLLSVVKQALAYRCEGPYDILTDDVFQSVKYGSPDSSAARFCRILAGRVQVAESLLEHGLFRKHVQPAPDPEARLWVIKRRDGNGRAHLILLSDEALLCDCANFHQHGRWCKHAFSLLGDSHVACHVALAIDSTYADPHHRAELPDLSQSKMIMTGPAVGHTGPAAARRAPFVVKKPWCWAKDLLALDASVEEEIAGMTWKSGKPEVAEVEEHESRSSKIRAIGHRSITLANSHPLLGERFLAIMAEFEQEANALTRRSTTNSGRVTSLNPLPNDRRAMLLAQNKSYTT